MFFHTVKAYTYDTFASHIFKPTFVYYLTSFITNLNILIYIQNRNSNLVLNIHQTDPNEIIQFFKTWCLCFNKFWTLNGVPHIIDLIMKLYSLTGFNQYSPWTECLDLLRLSDSCIWSLTLSELVLSTSTRGIYTMWIYNILYL